MIIACKLAHLEKYPTPDTERSSTPPPQESAFNCPLPLIIYPEIDLSVEVEDRRVDTKKGARRLRITGKADWAFGHGSRKESGTGTVLITVEAKNPDTFSKARSQLLTYLAIMKKLRRQEKKMGEYVQGFYSDGFRYCFISINQDNRVYGSKTYDCRFPDEIKVVFNWILDLLSSAAKSGPSTSPAKPGKEQDYELLDFQNQVFLRLYKPDIDPQDLDVDLNDPRMQIDELY